MEGQESKSLKEIVLEAFSLKEDTVSHAEIKARLTSAGKVTGTNLCMMACANIIACIGLNAGSMTVCVGAMLLEPLMGTILMITYSLVTRSKELFKSSGLGFVFQIVACLIVSTLYFVLTPVKDATDELILFSQVTLFDVLVAFFGGIAAAIGQTREDRFSTIIPGVAIATALMLPLCTCGYAIAMWQPHMLLGAAYMFIVNAYFISLGACLVLNLFRIPLTEEMTDGERAKGKRAMIIGTIIIAIPAVIVSLLLFLQ